jgi:endonuclease III related protein
LGSGVGLMEIYGRLFAHFGPQGWWPADDPFEMAVGAVLTQATAWRNVEMAIANLRRAGRLSVQGIHSAPAARLEELIRPSGYYRSKTKKLRALTEHIVGRRGGRLDGLFHVKLPALRAELLSIWGIGPETADSIALYGARQPIFVVDAYTRRIFHRLGLSRAGATYNELQDLFMEKLPPSVPLFQEYHALIVALGKDVCRPRAPRCHACPLRDTCSWPMPRAGCSSSISASASSGETIVDIVDDEGYDSEHSGTLG